MPSLKSICGAFCESASGVLMARDFRNAAEMSMNAGAEQALSANPGMSLDY